MALIYNEFDTTLGELTVALRNAILASSDWSKINSSAVIQSTSASASAGATALTFVSTTGFSVGQSVRVGTGPTAEYKNITATTATTITFTSQALLNAQGSGTQVFPLSEVLKATTTRGAEMIVDLAESSVHAQALVMAAWRAHDGTTGTDKTQRWMYHRAATATATTIPLHCIVSASKEHLFVSVEGPRANEPGASSATVGSVRNYFFFDDVVPYHASDTNPVVFAGGMMAGSQGASAVNNSHQGHFSRNYANTASWSVAKPLTLDFPTLSSAETVQVTRLSVGDGKYYLSPYVCFGDESGMRGRLASFFHAGFNSSDTPEIPSAPIGQKIQYDGEWYKILAVSKSDGANSTWSQLGAAANATSTTAHRSVLVAVPTTAP